MRGTRTIAWLRAIHILASVGWLATVGAFLVLATLGLAADADRGPGIYAGAEALTWALIVPLCALTLISGILVAARGPWGLLHHYWVVVKLGITVAATVALVIYLSPIHAAAHAGAAGPPMAARAQLGTASALALVLISVALWLSTAKPRGVTKRGMRARRAIG
jgi:hypothetical protein